jgi:hypothetical protein
MAHFALVSNGVVETIHVVHNNVLLDQNDVEQESRGQEFLANLHGYNADDLVQCSYNNTFRGSFPARGWIYDADIDSFLPPAEPVEVEDEAV